jgi:maleate isomerase
MLARRTRETGERFTFHSSRATLRDVTEQSLDRMVGESDRCARELSDARVDVLVYACLIAVMARGAGAHEEVEARLAQVASDSGCPMPVISSAGALVRALGALGAVRVAIVTPYLKPLTRLVERYLNANGIDVIDAISLEVSDNIEVGRLDPAQLVGLSRQLDAADADAVVISACVQMPSLPVVARIEEELGIPVLSAATATVFDTLSSLDLEPRVPDAGSLLAGSPQPAASRGG